MTTAADTQANQDKRVIDSMLKFDAKLEAAGFTHEQRHLIFGCLRESIVMPDEVVPAYRLDPAIAALRLTGATNASNQS